MTADYTFVNERLAQALRHPRGLRQPLPPRHADRRRAPRPARQGRGADGDVAHRPHLAGGARQVGARQPAGRAAAADARQRAAARRERAAGGARADDARAHGGAPHATRCAPTATRSWTRSAWRSRTSTPWARGARAKAARTAPPIDASGVLLDGTKVDGVVSLRQALLRDPEIFVGTVVEKLMTYALGRGVARRRHADRARDRARLGAAAATGSSSLVDGIVSSPAVPDARPVAIGAGERPNHVTMTRSTVMFITKKALSRRTILRGVGATLALPVLEAMVPALDARAAPRPRRSAGSGRCSCRSVSARASGSRRTIGRELRAVAHPEAAREVPEPHDGGVAAVRPARRPRHDGGRLAERRRSRSARSPRTCTPASRSIR